MSEYRKPTLDEAVRHLAGSLTRTYKNECVRYWRERYGVAFAEQIMREYGKRKKSAQG